MKNELTPAIESQALDQTEEAFRELVSVGQNIGLKKVQLAMMMRKIADELMPPIILPAGHLIQ